MIATQTDTVVNPVEKLTDEAIKTKIKSLDRCIALRQKKIDDLSVEIIGFNNQRADLVRAQIDRLKAQLPENGKQE